MINDEENKDEGDEEVNDYVTVDGVLIKQDFDHLIMDPSEVENYTSL